MPELESVLGGVAVVVPSAVLEGGVCCVRVEFGAGEGMRGGASAAVEVVTFAHSAAVAASLRLLPSSACSLFSLTWASAARERALTFACSNTAFSLE